MTELLDLKQASSILRNSIHTTRAWIYAGKLSYVKMGRKVLFRREDLEELINRSVVAPKKK